MKTAIQLLIILVLLSIIVFLGFSIYQKMMKSPPSVSAPINAPSSFSNQTGSGTTTSTHQFLGTIAIGMDYKVDYAAKLGYSFLQEVKREGEYGGTFTNVFGAKNAQIEVLDSSGKIIGLFNADQKGEFSFSVKKDDYYQLRITFQSIEKKLTVRSNEISGLNIYLGYINVANGKWSAS